jgi:hypothetical protein
MTRPIDQLCVNLCAQLYDGSGTWDHLDDGADDGVYWALKRVMGMYDIVVLRGSITAHDWVEDFRAFPVKTRFGSVHLGFYEGMEWMWKELAAMSTNPVVVTGHSLGAARADILCALMVDERKPPIHRAVFGEPRPGLQDFADFIKDVPGNGYRNADASGHDIVTDVPLNLTGNLSFIHPKPLVDVTASPTGSFFETHSPFAYHHIQLYEAALAASVKEIA